MEKLKIFVSQPMNGKTDAEIRKERKAIKKWIDTQFINYEIMDSYFTDEPEDAKPLHYLAKSLELLSQADVAVFAKNFDKARGCKIEFEAATSYGITCYVANYRMEILDEVEKKYLGNFINPWRGRISRIVKSDKWESGNLIIDMLTPDLDKHNRRLAYIEIIMKNSDPNDSNVILPCFNKKSGMYDGMELNREYTLDELGL